MARKRARPLEEKPGSPFDRLKRDRTCGGYSTKVTDRGCEINIRLDAESKAELDELLPTAMKFWRSRVRWFKAFRDYAAEELLATLNDFLDCGEDDPPSVTAQQLKRFLKAPFLVEFRRENDEDDICFILSGGEGAAMGEHCMEVVGTLEDGIQDGDVVSLL